MFIAMYDREYRGAYEALIGNGNAFLQNVDGPPTMKALFCRRIFKQLSLKHSAELNAATHSQDI